MRAPIHLARWRISLVFPAVTPRRLWYDSHMPTAPRSDAQPLARTAALVSIGCKVNQGELRQWGVSLAQVGVKLVDAGQPADLAIVNTCSVTVDGDKGSRKAIRHAARTNPGGYLVVTGCYASVDPRAVSEIDGVDLVVANDDKDEILRQLAAAGLVAALPAARGPDAWTHRSERPGWVTLMPALERRGRAFVKVQDGCNSHCTYCIVPAARGPQRSRAIQTIVDEVNLLYRLGYSEAVLTGVQIGAYGQDWDRQTRRVRKHGGPSLTMLVERVLADTPMPRIRISSIQPQDWPDGFLDLWQDPRLCRHLHLPLQSGSDTVLKRMVRRYRTANFRSLVEQVRAAMPDVAITADVMVGFPGESDTEHAASLAFVREMAFAEQHIFRYSARPGTAAARLPDDVSPQTKRQRSDEARALDRELRLAYQQRFLGQTLPVLWEEATPGPAREGVPPLWSGLTDNYLRVFTYGDLQDGQITPVRLEQQAEGGIFGALVQAAPLVVTSGH